MVDPKAAKFINSLVKSLQMLCHGCMDFNHNIEIIGHINLRIDNSQKFDYIVNEQVSKQGDDSTYFQSNSYHSLPPPKSSREKEKQQASSRSDDGSSIAESATNHHRLDSAAVVGSRVQIDLSGPISVSHEVESSPEHRFSISSNASNGGRRPSHSRDFSVDSEQNRLHDPLISFEDHAHNHSCSSGAAVRDKEGSERPASNSSSSERTDISSVFLGKDIEKRQQDCEGVVGQDGSIIVKAEPDDAAVEAAMEEEAEQQEHELLGIPSVSSVLPMAHQSALVANATHPSHAMFAAATLGHHGMFDSNLGAQDVAESHHGQRESSYHPLRGVGEHEGQNAESGQDLSKQGSQNKNGVAMSLVTRSRPSPEPNYPQGPTQLPQTAGSINPGQNRCDHCDSDVGRQSYVQEAFMQQILSAQKPTHLSHPGPDLDVFPLAMHRKVCGKESFLHPAPAHIQVPESLSHLSSSTIPIPLHPKPSLISSVLAASKLQDNRLINQKGMRHERVRGRGKGLGRVHFRCNDLLASAKERFPCSYCDYASVRRYNLERHIRLRHPSYRYKCPLPACGMILLDETELTTHIHIHDTISVVVCYGCNLPFDSWATLSHHQQVCRGFEGHPTVKVAQGGSGKGRRYKMGNPLSGCDLKQEPGDSSMHGEQSVGSASGQHSDTLSSRLVEYDEHPGNIPAEHSGSQTAKHTGSRPTDYSGIRSSEHDGNSLAEHSRSRTAEHADNRQAEHSGIRSAEDVETSMESEDGVEVVDYSENLPVHFIKKETAVSEEESSLE